MQIRVRLFAALAEAAHTRALALEVPDGASAAMACAVLVAQLPQIAPLCSRSALAVNAAYVEPDQRLHPGDELAVIPPVSGG